MAAAVERTADEQMEAVLQEQRAAQLADGPPSAEVRIQRINRLIRGVARRSDELVDRLSEDFGGRSDVQSFAADIVGSIADLEHVRRRVPRWMGADHRRQGIGLRVAGVRARVDWQPLGVVGIISPWNYPVALSLQPLGQALAAGNRAMVKMSELTPGTADLVREIVEDEFDVAEVAVITGGPDVAAAFSRLPFDRLFFTGATSVGREVMKAAAENLTPVTLELGGKSPVVVAPEADVRRVAEVLMFGKTFGSGQFCVSPDYVFVPAGAERAFVDAARSAVVKMFPQGLSADAHYTSIINRRHFDRLQRYLDDAEARGAEVIRLVPLGDGRNQGHLQIAPTVVLGTDDTMLLAQEEIFGPLLCVHTFTDIDEVIDHINTRPRPLAGYYFGDDTAARRRFLHRTTAGGVTLNDIMLHGALAELPFGGVGASGMGSYHGRAGFETFSHGRTVVSAPKLHVTRFLAPPYPGYVRSVLRAVVRRSGRRADRALRH